tara:strand:- start:9098 stop:9274 length:177 start_codon:yes stop_codon:yes gene_type:complete
MSEVNYLAVSFMCIIIIVCYTIGFVMGQFFEQSKQKDKIKVEQEKAKANANKKTVRRR